MFFPRFKAYHENLNTYYVDLPKLITFLTNDLFNGYIHIKGEGKEFFIFFEMGELLKCLDISDNQIKEISWEEITEQLHYNEYLNIYFLPEETIFFWANLAYATLLYPNLTSEFTDPVRLLNKLKKEGLTGFIEIIMDHEKSYIYFQEGSIIGTSSSWNKEMFIPGESEVSVIIGKIEKAIFNVYKVEEKAEMNLDKLLEEALKFFEKYISILEKSIGEKKFSTLWRQLALEKAEQYPFLDPFAGEFEYKKGKINLWSDISTVELTEGLKEVCLELAKEANLLPQQKEVLEKLKRDYKELIKRLNLFPLFS
jgi:hypothetical protein